MGGSTLFGDCFLSFFYTRGFFNLFLPKPIPHLQYRVCGGGSGIRVESSGYIFSPALASIERTSIVGLLLSDFHTAIIASASNHESAGGAGDEFFFLFFLFHGF